MLHIEAQQAKKARVMEDLQKMMGDGR